MVQSRSFTEECSPNGTFITLANHSMSKDIDISRWTLKRRLDANTENRYTIPEGVRLQQGRELRIYSRLGATAESSTNSRADSSMPRRELVNNALDSWGMADLLH